MLLAADTILFFPLAMVAIRTSFAQVLPVLHGRRKVVVGRRAPPWVLPSRSHPRHAAAGIGAGAALVFIAVITELTATLLPPPIGTTTLATRFWAEASEVDYGAAEPGTLPPCPIRCRPRPCSPHPGCAMSERVVEPANHQTNFLQNHRVHRHRLWLVARIDGAPMSERVRERANHQTQSSLDRRTATGLLLLSHGSMVHQLASESSWPGSRSRSARLWCWTGSTSTCPSFMQVVVGTVRVREDDPAADHRGVRPSPPWDGETGQFGACSTIFPAGCCLTVYGLATWPRRWAVPHLDVAANVSFGLKRAGSSTSPARSTSCSPWSGSIWPFADRAPHQLLGRPTATGRPGRRPCSPEPAVALLDEPSGLLDTALRDNTQSGSGPSALGQPRRGHGAGDARPRARPRRSPTRWRSCHGDGSSRRRHRSSCTVHPPTSRPCVRGRRHDPVGPLRRRRRRHRARAPGRRLGPAPRCRRSDGAARAARPRLSHARCRRLRGRPPWSTSDGHDAIVRLASAMGRPDRRVPPATSGAGRPGRRVGDRRRARVHRAG